MNSISLQSPAKLNLALRVVNKRPDGYHNLETLFERISLWDDMTFRSNSSGRIHIECNDSLVPRGPKNLVYKVAFLLKAQYGVKQGVDVTIKKRIPVAAGLAGGSSNGATALVGLNHIWKLNLSQKKLVDFGKQIGSDVAFFLYDCSYALGLSRGDEIYPQKIPLKLWHVLVVPRLKIYSREVFRGLKLQLTKPNDNVNILIRSFQKNDLGRAGKILFNDLEDSILGVRPSLRKVKQRLSRYDFLGVSFSGSGPSVFGLVRSQEEAEQIRLALGKRYSRVFVVSTF